MSNPQITTAARRITRALNTWADSNATLYFAADGTYLGSDLTTVPTEYAYAIRAGGRANQASVQQLLDTPQHVTDEEIWEAIRELILADAATGPNEWMMIRKIKQQLIHGDVTSERIDAVMIAKMTGCGPLVIIGEANQKALTQADRDAAVWVGGEYRHVATLKELDQ